VRSRLAARLVTGPLGFFLAGVVDVTLAWLGWGVQTLVARMRRAAR
jgi:hypothetical protein